MKIATALPLGWLLATALVCFSPPLADNDLWGHVLFGREILAAGILPETNRFSYTAPDYPWINHESLAEITFAVVFERLGAPGLLVLKLLLGLAALAFLIAVARRRTPEPLAWTMGLGVACWLMSEGYLVRPQLFTYLGLAILWERLDAATMRRSLRPISVLPLLFAVWINAHGGVVAGFGVFMVWVVFAWRSADGEKRRNLALLVGACMLALLLNPYGLSLPLFLARDVTLTREISEWAPVPLATTERLGLKLAVVAALAGAILRSERRAWELAVVVLAAVGTLRHVRHQPLFAVLAAPLLAETAGAVLRQVPELLGRRFVRVTIAVLLISTAVFQVCWVYQLNHALGFQIVAQPSVFPVNAVRFLERNGLRGNLALPFDWGEYALWHLHPRCRVSIDGRYTTAYPDAVIEMARRFESGEPGWDDVLRDASLILASRRQGSMPLLARHPEWMYVYSDEIAFVFVRRGMPLPDPLDRGSWRDKSAFFFP